ncbi:MAG: hypothetical protein NTV94_10955, partial [Planctomycetota bacterium]|nr:hypothetical protein [Planctomycetota bacterium]
QLAGDLAVTVGTPTLLFNALQQNDLIKVPVTITNLGDRVVKAPFRMIVSLSSDTTVGNDYVYFQKVFSNWVPKGKTFTPDLTAPMPFDPVGNSGNSALLPGSYHVRVQLFYTDGSFDANTGNNNVFTSGTVPLAYNFGGDIRRNQRRTITIFTSNVQQMKFEINGPGTGTISFANGNTSVTVNGTTSASSLWIKPTNKFATATLSLITVNGSLQELRAPSVALNGNLTVSGDLRHVSLASITGSTWTINGTQSTSGFIGAVVNTSLDSDGSIGILTVASWTTSDSGTDAIIAHGIANLKVNGNFTPTVSLLEGAKTVSIAGEVDGLWDVGGAVGTFAAASSANSFSLNSARSIGTFTLSGSMGGSISAPTIDSVTITGSLNAAAILAGTDLGSDAAVGGAGTAADIFSAGSLGSLQVRGAATNSLIACSLNPIDGQFFNTDDRFASSSSRIGSIRIGGATFETNFAAKQFDRYAQLTHVKITTATDSRFRSNFALIT